MLPSSDKPPTLNAPTHASHPMLQFFEFKHLPPSLQAISQPFGYLAADMIRLLPDNAERTMMLRKLMEAKDCAVRAHLYKPDWTGKVDPVSFR